jgi:hypothetical protein
MVNTLAYYGKDLIQPIVSCSKLIPSKVYEPGPLSIYDAIKKFFNINQKYDFSKGIKPFMTTQVTKWRYIIFPDALSLNGIFPKCKVEERKGVDRLRF